MGKVGAYSHAWPQGLWIMGNYEIFKHLPPGFYHHDNAHVKCRVRARLLSTNSNQDEIEKSSHPGKP